MYRLMFAVLVGLLLVALTSRLAVAQEPKGGEKSTATKAEGKPAVIQATTKWLDENRVFSILGLVFMCLIIFQLIMVRSSLEKLVEKSGGTN